MLKNIKKFIQSRRFAIPILGLVITIGASAQRIQPVLSKQIARLQAASLSATLEEAPKSTWIEGNPDVSSQSISKEARLKRVLNTSTDSDASTSVLPGKTYVWMQGHNSSSHGDVAQDKTSTSTVQARVPEDKASVRGAIPADNFPNGDGVFLYGNSQKAGEFGKGYIVFEKQADKVIGGMYMPASEFNCFQGSLDRSGEIAMTVKGYAGDVSPPQVAARSRLVIPGDSEFTKYAYSVTLKDFYQLENVGKNDQRILKICKANFQ
ncbi:hypothetical protein NIES267_17740 [Calothrix parasitica NIES-267]|uniref:Uncharacterized protein n=1 Tax=Calothrix parasitica NIES-267 TaxID=1973488 RepID=A0A1Z4LM47_9CYAN|nr:hypothetical protein NIES267_17740 [Calothrix parasitica NIES-267]